MQETKMVRKPEEGQWFDVNPMTIDERLFYRRRKDKDQEVVRQTIILAFSEVKKNPNKYMRKFKTLVPFKDWDKKSMLQFKQYCAMVGDHMADWVEQALEWAQRIHNGESWESVCNKADTSKWYRVIVWKDNAARLVGGSIYSTIRKSSTSVYHYSYHFLAKLHCAVPLVVDYQ